MNNDGMDNFRDTDLLKAYVAGDEAAFRALVERHIDWIYSTAFRQTCNRMKAEDVAQGVLLALAKKAAALQRHPSIVSWVFRAIRYGSNSLLREERRRKARELAAAKEAVVQLDEQVEWAELESRLDEAVARLSKADQETILLRFYCQLTHGAMGTLLGISEEAARKRVDRAVVRLRDALDLQQSTIAFAEILNHSAVIAAPIYLHTFSATSATAATNGVLVSKEIQTTLTVAKWKWWAAIVTTLLLPAAIAGGLLANRRPSPAALVITVSTTAPATAMASNDSTNEGTVHGIVVTTDDKPMPGVEVYFPTLRTHIAAITDQNGQFTLTAPAFARPLYLLARTKERLLQSLKSRYEAPTDTQLLKEVRIVLKPARSLKMEIVDSAEKGVDHATVAAANYMLLGQCTTDAYGKGTLLIPADATLDFICAFKEREGFDYRLFWQDYPGVIHNDPYHLASDYQGSLKLLLDGTKIVTVHAADEKGNPLAKVSIEPWYVEKPDHGGPANFSGLYLLDTVTDGRGNASINFLPSDNRGAVPIWTMKEEYFAVDRWSANLKGGDVQIAATLLPLVPITGRVVGKDGKAVAHAEMQVGSGGYGFESFSLHSPLITAEDGSFSVSVYPDQYYAFLATDGHRVSDIVACAVRTLPPEKPLELVLHEGQRLHGTVTAGADHKPVPNVPVSAVMRDESYRDLPADQQLPNPKKIRRVITALIKQSTQSDAKGNYEVFLPAGSGYLEALVKPGWVREQWKLKEGEDASVEIHADSEAGVQSMIQGRVVLQETPTRGAARVSLKASPLDLMKSISLDPTAISNPDGTFQIARPTSEFYLHAASADGSHGAMLRIKPEDAIPPAITLSPTVALFGKVVDLVGKPMANYHIYYGIHLGLPEQGSSLAFTNMTSTDKDGNFRLTGVVPQTDYEMDVYLHADAHGHPIDNIHVFDHLRATTPIDTDVGDQVWKETVQRR